MNYYNKYLIYKYKYYSLLNLQKGGYSNKKVTFDNFISRIKYNIYNHEYTILFLTGNFFYMFNEVNTHPLALNSNISTNKIIDIKKLLIILDDLIYKLESQNKCLWCTGNDLKYPSFYLKHYVCLLIIKQLVKLCNISHVYIEEMSWTDYFPKFNKLNNFKLIYNDKLPLFKNQINNNDDSYPLIIIDCGSTKTKISLNINHSEYNNYIDFFNKNEIILLPLHSIEHESKFNLQKFLNLCKNILNNKYSGILLATAGIRNYLLSNDNKNQFYINSFLEKLNNININSHIISGEFESFLEWNSCNNIIKNKLKNNKSKIIMCSMGGNSIQFSNGNINKSYDFGSIFLVKNCMNIINELIDNKYKCNIKHLNIVNNKITVNIKNIINDIINNFRFVCI